MGPTMARNGSHFRIRDLRPVWPEIFKFFWVLVRIGLMTDLFQSVDLCSGSQVYWTESIEQDIKEGRSLGTFICLLIG